MDYQSVLNEVESWDVADRIRFVKDVWGRLEDEGFDPDMTEELKAELDCRVEELRRDPSRGVPWEAAKARLVAKFGR